MERVAERGLDTSHFAAYAETNFQTASRWLAGENRPGTSSCYKIAKAIRRDPREVLARAGHLQLDATQLEGLDLEARLSAVEERFQRAGDQFENVSAELRRVREEVQRWRERLGGQRG